MNRFINTLAALGLSLAATSAQATLMQTQTWFFTDELSDSFVFDSFDTSLGTLTGVDVLLTGSANISGGSVSGFADSNRDGFEGHFEFFGYLFGVVYADGMGLGVFLQDLLHGPDVRCHTSNTPGACFDDYSADADPFSDSMSISPSTFGNYIDRNPEFFLWVDTEFVALDGQLLAGPSTNWNATGELNLIYTYDPAVAVPVPATFTLLGLGLAGLGWSRRKRA